MIQIKAITVFALCGVLWGQNSGKAPAAIDAPAIPAPSADATHSFELTTSAMTPEQRAALEEKWGVRVELVALTAATMMVDVRLRVLDPVKADSLFSHSHMPVLINPATGHKMQVPNTPTIGRLRPTAQPQINRVYPFIFGNALRELRVGDKVTLQIGDFEAANLIVQ